MFLVSSDRIRPIMAAGLFVAGLLLLLVFSESLSAWRMVHLELHATIETLGGVSAILISIVLLRESRDNSGYMLPMAATGFATMGILDTAHAMSHPGDAFIFLHSAASLAGGFFFSLAWLPYHRKDPMEHQGIFYGSIVLAASIALRALLYPGDVPKIVRLHDGEFTLAAVLINTAAGLLFLSSVPRFYGRYRKEKKPWKLVLTYLGILFGLAEMIFQFSNTWNGFWWVWHFIRFAAFLITLMVLFNIQGIQTSC